MDAARVTEITETVESRLREQADRGYPDAWIPENPGDELIGCVAAVEPSVQTKHGCVPVVTIATGTGAEYSVWLTHTVLRNAFARQRPVIGETVLIRYRGRVQPDGGGASYADYLLIVDRPKAGQRVDWDSIAAAHKIDLGDQQPVQQQPEFVPAGTSDGAAAFADFGQAPDADDIPF